MKNLDLNAYGVSEMTSEEMLMVEGGNVKEILKKVGDAIATAAEAVADAAVAVAEWIGEHVSPAPEGQSGVIIRR